MPSMFHIPETIRSLNFLSPQNYFIIIVVQKTKKQFDLVQVWKLVCLISTNAENQERRNARGIKASFGNPRILVLTLPVELCG